MVVTDGAPMGYKDVFDKYNWKHNGSLVHKWVSEFLRSCNMIGLIVLLCLVYTGSLVN